jgi:hypothetical protein
VVKDRLDEALIRAGEDRLPAVGIVAFGDGQEQHRASQ